jgi:hypothetical protein
MDSTLRYIATAAFHGELRINNRMDGEVMSVTGTENDVGGFGECLTAEQLVITG